LDRGLVRHTLKDYAGALADAEQVVAMNPRSCVGYNNLGAAKEKLGDLEGALKDYQKALEIEPAFEKGLKNRERVKALLKK
jgi:tetratricopeptide (TPR) repeat protein